MVLGWLRAGTPPVGLFIKKKTKQAENLHGLLYGSGTVARMKSIRGVVYENINKNKTVQNENYQWLHNWPKVTYNRTTKFTIILTLN